MKRLLITLIVVLSGFGLNANAQSFTVGLNAGLPSLLELRVGYETPEFGVRATAAGFVFPSLGLDAYAILPNPWGHWRAGAGVAIVNEAFSGSTFLTPHALLGTRFDFGPNLALALEWRPGFPVLLSPGAGNSSRAQSDLLQYMLLSFGLALELRF